MEMHIIDESTISEGTNIRKNIDDNKELSIPRIAKFFKVSFEQFVEDYKPIWIATQKAINNIQPGESFGYDKQELIDTAKSIYENIQLPKRSTKGSAGYDFFFPFADSEIPAGASVTIPTGIKVQIKEGWVLKEYPRSSLGFKYRMQLDNTVGIIDSDYFDNENNEGHIMIKITNDNRDDIPMVLTKGMKFCQGIFVQFGITEDDEVTEERTGGLGSTGA